MVELPFNQTVELTDLAVIGLLVVLEGVLSIDNALVLGLLAKRLSPHQRGRALTYGLIGAFVFRFLSIAAAQYLLRWQIVKLIGGAYLLYVALKHFLVEHGQEEPADGSPTEGGAPSTGSGRRHAGFWSTVVVIELTDIAFAIDSILAAIALVGSSPEEKGIHPKLWVVVSGGMLGVVLMRFAAVVFIRLLERFPRFEISAYLLVLVIGLKLAVDWLSHTSWAESWHQWVNFHDLRSPAFWTFWLAMLVCLGIGFLPAKKSPASAATVPPPDPST